jgi:hypothetical protein
MSTAGALRAIFAAADEKRDVMEPLRRVAALAGWMTFHPHRSQQSEAGFPDLVFVRSPRQDARHYGPPYILFVETKREKGRLSAAQRAWGTALGCVELVTEGAVAYRLARPSSRHEVEALLVGAAARSPPASERHDAVKGSSR